ncbi:cytochrome P450 2J2-like isoform X2 [Clupea harengus]|uniref:Cytochrome P450 2J2-like isoform X2 n=1 Tax=Clupea harengus TaxID=7950 RepID=A0A6P8G3Y0_CLUHA|nr:cytochrome P450 2J2-like isoform X2 [Clupea harengus]
MTVIFHILELLDIKSFLLFAFIFLLIFDYIKSKPPKNFPPGPWSLPFIGDLHHIDFTEIHLQFVKFAEKYGQIFSIRFFGPRIVLLNGLKLVREAYVHQGENFADRPSLPLFADIVGDKGKPFNPMWLVNNAVSNIICVLVFGERFEYSNNDFQALLKDINEVIFLEGSAWAQLYNIFPWLMRRVPGPHQKIFALWEKQITFVKKKIEDHRVDYDPSNLRDYIDCFIGEMEKYKDDEASGFNVENLSFCTLDLFLAGTETTYTTLYWGLLYMIKYPEIQRKVQEEIDRVVGSSRPPSLTDRENMPYTDAVIHETQRIGNILPLNVGRSATKDTQVGGYIIPKGTMVLASLTSVLFDETEWETPHTFNPEHFLDTEGKFRRREGFLPFSIGKRVCLGEQMARMELFLFFTSLLQRFSFSAPQGVEPKLECRLGATHSPQPYQLCAVPR